MALYYNLPVYKASYELMKMLFACSSGFAREYKYTTGQELKNEGMSLIKNIYRANKAQSKTEYLEAFLDDFEVLKLEVRLCVDLKILPIRKQAELAALMDSIGRQITGWRNAGLPALAGRGSGRRPVE